MICYAYKKYLYKGNFFDKQLVIRGLSWYLKKKRNRNIWTFKKQTIIVIIDKKLQNRTVLKPCFPQKLL